LLKEGKLDQLLQEQGNTHTVEVTGLNEGTTAVDLKKLLQANNLNVESIQAARRPLDRVFLDIVQKDKETEKS